MFLFPNTLLELKSARPGHGVRFVPFRFPSQSFCANFNAAVKTSAMWGFGSWLCLCLYPSLVFSARHHRLSRVLSLLGNDRLAGTALDNLKVHVRTNISAKTGSCTIENAIKRREW